MGILYFGDNQQEITSLYNDSAINVAVHMGNNIYGTSAESIAHNLTDTVTRLVSLNNTLAGRNDTIPRNIKVSLYGYSTADNKNMKKENTTLLFGVAIKLDYLHANGKRKNAVFPKIIVKELLDRVGDTIPIPSFAVVADVVYLVYEFDQPWVLPAHKKKRKEFLGELKDALKRIADRINQIDQSMNATVANSSRGIPLPETECQKFERQQNGKYKVTVDVMTSIMPISKYKYTPFMLMKAKKEAVSCNENLHQAEIEKMEEILHRNCKGGNVLIAMFNNQHLGSLSPTYLSYTPSVKKLMATSKCDTYIYLQKQKGNGTNSDAAFNFPGIYIDLDLTNKTQIDKSEREQLLLDAINELRAAISNERVPMPTLVCCTGGGLAIYYLLNTPIPNINLDAAEKAKKFLYDLWDYYMDVYSDIYAKLPVETDRSCKSDWHLVRLAGTYNTETKSYCQMVEFNGNPYYDLTQLAQYRINVEKQQNQSQCNSNLRSAPERNNKYVFSVNREEAWAELIREKIEKKDGLDGKTEVLFHLYANMLAYNFSQEEVIERLVEANSQLDDPLSESRLHDAISVFNYMKRMGTPYKYSDARLHTIIGNITGSKYVSVEKVHHHAETRKVWEEWRRYAEAHKKGSKDYMTLSQVAEHFNIATSTLKNAFKQINYKRGKEVIDERWNKWIEFARLHDGNSEQYYSLKEIAKHFDVSEKTLRNALKAMGYTRHRQVFGRKNTNGKKSTTFVYRILCTSIRSHRGSFSSCCTKYTAPYARGQLERTVTKCYKLTTRTNTHVPLKHNTLERMMHDYYALSLNHHTG